jgi:hypothetical protein
MAPKRIVTMPLSWKASGRGVRSSEQSRWRGEQTGEEEGDVDHAHEDTDEHEAVVAHVDRLEDPGREEAQAVADDHRPGEAQHEVHKSDEEFFGADAHTDELAGGPEKCDGHGVVHHLGGGSVEREQGGEGELTDSPKTR